MRKWEKYLNRQRYMECQLVTALNAYYCLTGKVYCKQDSQEYEDLVDLCCARIGAAISIEKIHKKLGLKIAEKHRFLWGFRDKKLPLPIEVSIWHRITGNHSVLIVDHSIKCNAVRIANFRYETRSGWIFIDDLKLYENRCFSGDDGINSKGKPWNYRLFVLKDKNESL